MLASKIRKQLAEEKLARVGQSPKKRVTLKANSPKSKMKKNTKEKKVGFNVNEQEDMDEVKEKESIQDDGDSSQNQISDKDSNDSQTDSQKIKGDSDQKSNSESDDDEDSEEEEDDEDDDDEDQKISDFDISIDSETSSDSDSDSANTPETKLKQQKQIQEKLNLGIGPTVFKQQLVQNVPSKEDGKKIETPYLQTLSQNQSQNKQVNIEEYLVDGELNIEVKVRDYFNFMRLTHEIDELERISQNQPKKIEVQVTQQNEDSFSKQDDNARMNSLFSGLALAKKRFLQQKQNLYNKGKINYTKE